MDLAKIAPIRAIISIVRAIRAGESGWTAL